MNKITTHKSHLLSAIGVIVLIVVGSLLINIDLLVGIKLKMWGIETSGTVYSKSHAHLLNKHGDVVTTHAATVDVVVETESSIKKTIVIDVNQDTWDRLTIGQSVRLLKDPEASEAILMDYPLPGLFTFCVSCGICTLFLICSFFIIRNSKSENIAQENAGE